MEVLEATWLPAVLTIAARCHLAVLRHQHANASRRWLKACEDRPATSAAPANQRLRWLLRTVHLRRWEQVRASANLTAICAVLTGATLVGSAVEWEWSLVSGSPVTPCRVVLFLLAGTAIAVLVEALLIRHRLQDRLAGQADTARPTGTE